MESVEPVTDAKLGTSFYDFDDDEAVTVELNKGLKLNDLQTDRGAEFEVKAPVDYDDPDTNDYFETEEVFKQLNRECLGDDDDTDDDGLTPFEKMAKKMDDITPEKDRTVLKSILKRGTGALPVPGMTLTVHYNCYVEYSDEPYDSTRLRNKPEKCKLGAGKLVPGMELGLSTMRQGEIAKFLIHPDHGYGKLGVPPRIPANATLLMEIELLSFTDRAELDEFNNMSEEERKEITFKRKLKVVNMERQEGNSLFEEKKYKLALSRYSKGLRILEGANLQNEDDEDQMKRIRVKLCLNIALCCMKLKMPERAIKNCNDVLEVERTNVKALYRKGMALKELKDFQAAHKYLNLAKQQNPQDSSVQRGLMELDKDWRSWNMLERSRYTNMFPDMKKDSKRESGSSQGKVPEDVRKNIRETLRNFKEGDRKNEMTYTASTMATAEIEFLEMVAKEFNLTFLRRDYQGEKIIKIMKEPPGQK